jgi:biopolymer transport protein ExbD
MRTRRGLSKLLVEPAAVATGDIAFNLIVFFLVCASSQPSTGRRQDLPSSEKSKQEQQNKSIEVSLTRSATMVTVNGDPMKSVEFPARIVRLLSQKQRPEDRVVIVKSTPDTPYQHWIDITSQIQDAGGSITIQREEQRTEVVGQ